MLTNKCLSYLAKSTTTSYNINEKFKNHAFKTFKDY